MKNEFLRSAEKIFRQFFPKRIGNAEKFLQAVKNKNGLEIGGPSACFTSSGFLPVYPVVANLDGCNFGTQTVWEGHVQEGKTFRFGKRLGKQIICDASTLDKIADDSYEFILSSHCLEHLANPLKALNNWKRVLQNDGYLILILPHKDQTFDHKRPVTTLQHIITDETRDMQENDETHFDEVLALHDISMDRGISSQEALAFRTKHNLENRCVHHHVFNTPLVFELLHYNGWQILEVAHSNPFHIIVLARFTQNKIDNFRFLDGSHLILQNPKFPSDNLLNAR